MNLCFKNRRCGFSLIEMLISLALVLIMAAMLMGRGSNSRQKRDLVACEKNLQSIFASLAIYATDNADRYPFVSNAKTSEEPLSLLVPRSTTLTAMFICPGTKDSRLPEAESFADRKISYAYYMGWNRTAPGIAPLVSDRQINPKPKRAGERLFSGDGEGDGANHHKYGGNVLFNGGEVRKSGTNATFDLLFPTNVVFLSPKP